MERKKHPPSPPEKTPDQDVVFKLQFFKEKIMKKSVFRITVASKSKCSYFVNILFFQEFQNNKSMPGATFRLVKKLENGRFFVFS